MSDGCTTTKKDFEVFKKEADAWLKRFGMLDWRVEYLHNDENEDARGCINWMTDGRLAQIILTITWDHKPTKRDIQVSAFHEVCELLLGQLRDCAFDRFDITRERIDAATHYAVRTLENVVFKPLT